MAPEKSAAVHVKRARLPVRLLAWPVVSLASHTDGSMPDSADKISLGEALSMRDTGPSSFAVTVVLEHVWVS